MANPKWPGNRAYYDLKKPESFHDIAIHQLKDAKLAQDLAALNASRDALKKMPAGTRIILPDYSRYDYTVTFMCGEMVKNAKSAIAQKIANYLDGEKQSLAKIREADADLRKAEWYEVLRMSGDTMMIDNFTKIAMSQRANAQVDWFRQVHSDGVWDHKPILSKYYLNMPFPPRPFGSIGDMGFHFPIRGDLFREYYYDIWSNIHYGFVGTRCGFDDKTLQDGAAAGLPGFGTNDEGDVISVQIGIDLWKSTGLGLTEEKLRQAIVAKGSAYEAARASDLKKGLKDKATNTVIRDNDYK